jgi:phosphoglucomutase
MNPNHVLAVAIDYLLTHRPDWSPQAAIGKTMVSSSMIDRVVAHHGRDLLEVPVGFKWFGEGLTDGSLCFGGEESAGAVCVARDGSVWVSEKDGIIMGLLMAEILATTGDDPATHYRTLEKRHGATFYRRQDFPANADSLARLKTLDPADVSGRSLAQDPIIQARTSSPSGAALGGIRLDTENGWVAARPSGTEPIYKIYAESFRSAEHLEQLLKSAEEVISGGSGHGR